MRIGAENKHDAVVGLAERILVAKQAEVRGWEQEIDSHVYRLYGLPPPRSNWWRKAANDEGFG